MDEAYEASRTVTVVDSPPVGVLVLRRRPAVQWDESVVDNEHLGRKKSKICCIYHRPRTLSDSSSDSDCDCNAYERQPRNKK